MKKINYQTESFFKLGRKFSVFKPGSALILTMFILAGMMIVAFTGSYIVLVGIKSSGVQYQSTQAYFAAESGAEQLLYKLRRGEIPPEEVSETAVLSGEFSSGAKFQVFYINRDPMVYHSIGEYQKTKRSVELLIGDR